MPFFGTWKRALLAKERGSAKFRKIKAVSKFTGTGRVVDKDAKPERGRRRKSLEIPQQPCGQSCWSHFAAHILALPLPQLIYCSDRGFIYSSYPSVLPFIMHTESKIWISEDWSLMRNISANPWLFMKQHQEHPILFRSLPSCSWCFTTSLLMSPGVQCLVPLPLTTFWQFPLRHFANVTLTTTSQHQYLGLDVSHVLGQSGLTPCPMCNICRSTKYKVGLLETKW